MSVHNDPIVVVGAGMAGLSAARALVDAGHPVRVLDKGKSVGGRLATRRIGAATLDHGAQFFTVRTDEFEALVDRGRQAGLVYEWCRGFAPETEADGYPRYASHAGMNALAKHLAADVDVSVAVEIDSVARSGLGWELRHREGVIRARAVVLTAPVPQSLALLDAGGTQLDGGTRSRLAAVDYHPTLALLVTLDAASAVPSPGAVQFTDGPFGFIADNQAKGISTAPAVTFHASHAVSRQRWNEDAELAEKDLLALAKPWLGEANVVDAQLKRWRYAQPVVPATDEFEATTVDGAAIVFAGDAFAGAKVEGAFRSGRGAAHHLIDVLGEGH